MRASSLAHAVSGATLPVAAQMDAAGLRKRLGAFYTGTSAADRLVNWAVQEATDAVLDPSCGDGIFLGSAYSRLRMLGSESPVVYGVDVSADAIRKSHERVESAKVVRNDFFALTPGDLQRFDAIVGNPPFIRYQTFNGDKDSLGHQRAAEAGVKLPRLASSWAPFVIHASRFLRCGGRLAMVMPAELGHAMYAREVLRFLVDNFRHVAVEMFRVKLFEDLSQSTVLLFCEGYGEPSRVFLVASSDNLGGNDRQVAKVDVSKVKSGRFRFAHYILSERARLLYENLAADPRVQELGNVADVGIGYVTGANEFFHLSAEESVSWEIPKRFLRPCLLNLRGFDGIQFTQHDWRANRDHGEKAYLLALPSGPASALPASVQTYLRYGESKKLNERYKCRVRDYWHAVPHVRIADAFLSYMSGEQPLLVTNSANLVAPNTVHILRFEKGCNPRFYAASWRTSLTKLSCELEGHSLGGGLFKLEPSEAEKVLIVRPPAALFKSLLSKVEGIVNRTPGKFSEALDRYVLRRHLGLSEAECAMLADSARKIELWRKHQ